MSAPPSPLSKTRLLAATLTGALATALAATSAAPGVATAQVVVHDPSNHAQGVIEAARTVEQLANQAAQLANEAAMLARSPYDHMGEVGEALETMESLRSAAEGLAADLDGLERQFEDLYPDDLSGRNLQRDGVARLEAARRTAEDLARVAAGVGELQSGRDARVRGALAASRTAQGQTAAIQSSAQLLGVLAEDLASLRTVMLAQSRLMATEAARSAAEREAASENRRRLWGREASVPGAPAFDPLARSRD